MAEILRLHKISKSFNNIPVLDQVDFSLDSGEIHALVGENGSGKTTLVKIISGLCPADSGTILLDGQEIVIRNTLQAEKLGILSMHQDYTLFENMSIAENIFLNHEPTRNIRNIRVVNWALMYSLTKKILQSLNWNISPKMSVQHLNAGERKLVELARIISYHARIIILDEPTALLNAMEINYMLSVIVRLKQSGVAVVFISHQIDEVKNIADRITILSESKAITVENKSNLSRKAIIKMIAGDIFHDVYPKLNLEVGTSALLIRNLCVNEKLRDINIDLKKNEILGITGVRGSGKTTLANVLFGLERKYSGNIYVQGKKINIRSPEDSVANGIAYLNAMGKHLDLISEMSIADNIIVPKMQNLCQYFCLTHTSKYKNALKYIRMLKIKAHSPSDKVRYLSGGTQKKVSLAKWLFSDAQIFILNNPTSGIDVSAKIDIYNIVNSLAISGTSVICISNDICELLGMCNRILVMYEGRIAKEFRYGEASKEEIMSYSLGNEESVKKGDDLLPTFRGGRNGAGI